MAKYHLEKKRNRLNQTKDGLWYAAPAPRQKLSTGDLCRYAVRNTTLNPAEVRAVLDLINEFVPRYLAEGYVIRLGELGSLSLAYGSEGVAQPEDFHPRLMRPARVVFQPSKRLTQAVRGQLTYEAGGIVADGVSYSSVADYRRRQAGQEGEGE